MKEKPLVSVIIPVYNAEAYLKESIASVLSQSYEALEVILVDDCSADGSLGICRSFAEQDHRVLAVALEENLGAGRARNEGIRRASGKYLTFADADDAIDARIIERAVELAEDHELDWVVWGIREECYDPRGELVCERNLLPEDRCYPMALQARQAVITLEEQTLFGYQWNKLYLTSIVWERGILFEDTILYEDFFFNVAYAREVQRLGTLSLAGYCYKKRNQDSVTAGFVKEYFTLSRRRVQEMWDLYKEWKMLGRREKDILGNIYLRYTVSALARNCDPRSGMDGRARGAWIRKRCKDPLYLEAAAGCRPRRKEYGLTRFLLNRRWILALRGLGRALYILQRGCKTLFVKEKSKG